MCMLAKLWWCRAAAAIAHGHAHTYIHSHMQTHKGTHAHARGGAAASAVTTLPSLGNRVGMLAHTRTHKHTRAHMHAHAEGGMRAPPSILPNLGKVIVPRSCMRSKLANLVRVKINYSLLMQVEDQETETIIMPEMIKWPVFAGMNTSTFFPTIMHFVSQIMREKNI